MKVHKEIAALFAPKELEYIIKEATLAYTNDNDEIDYLFWLRDKGRRAEIRLDYAPGLTIWRLDEDSEEETYTREELLQMLRSSSPNKLEYIEVE